MNPVKGYTISQLKSMQNVQYLMYPPGANIVICEYIVKMDDCSYTVVSTDDHKNETLITQFTYLHNTKVSTSVFNKAKAIEKDKKKNRPK